MNFRYFKKKLSTISLSFGLAVTGVNNLGFKKKVEVKEFSYYKST